MKDLICPLCSLSLSQNSQGLACINRHQFDRAKEGYFNLLPVHHKNSREPGDSKQQLLARRMFLTSGHFFPLVAELKKLINSDASTLLDIGCGEGYFTRCMSDHLQEATIYGIDIAKAGVRLAAKNSAPGHVYAVASSHLLPFADESIDVITRIYAPSKDQELARVLKSDGLLIMVTPGEEHLLNLRKRIYETVKAHPKPNVPNGFRLINIVGIKFALRVPSGNLSAALLEMTPFSWKLTKELHAEIVDSGLSDGADFQIAIFKKVI